MKKKQERSSQQTPRTKAKNKKYFNANSIIRYLKVRGGAGAARGARGVIRRPGGGCIDRRRLATRELACPRTELFVRPAVGENVLMLSVGDDSIRFVRGSR